MAKGSAPNTMTKANERPETTSGDRPTQWADTIPVIIQAARDALMGLPAMSTYNHAAPTANTAATGSEGQRRDHAGIQHIIRRIQPNTSQAMSPTCRPEMAKR